MLIMEMIVVRVVMVVVRVGGVEEEREEKQMG